LQYSLSFKPANPDVHGLHSGFQKRRVSQTTFISQADTIV